MYGVESVVHPAARSRGVGGQLMEARFDVLRRLNLRGMVAGSAIVDYHTASHLSAEEYVRQVVAGLRFDTNLTKQLRKGFKVHNLIPNFIEGYADTLGWGVTIVWTNPDHRDGARPLLHVQPRQFAVAWRATPTLFTPAVAASAAQ